MNCGVGWLFLTALENMKKENNRQALKSSTERVPTWQHLERLSSPVAGGRSMRKSRPSRGGQREGTKVIFEEIMAEKFLNLMKDMDPHIQEAQ